MSCCGRGGPIRTAQMAVERIKLPQPILVHPYRLHTQSRNNTKVNPSLDINRLRG
jgi:hypothetical protein